MLVVGERCGKIYFTRPYYRGVVREDLAHEYFVNYYPHDEAPHRRRELPSGQMVHALELYTEEELKTSIAYNEGWRLLHGQNGVNINFRQPDGLHIFLGVGDPASGEWTSDALQMIERLGPHIQRAVIIRQALAAADALDAGPAGLMENDRIGVVQLDRGGRMLEANAVALEILHHGDGLVERDGTLNAVLPADRSRLRRLLASALPDFLGEAPSGGFETAETLPGLSLSVSPEVTSYGFWGAHGFAALTLGAGSLAAETDGTEYMGPGTAATSPWRRRTWPATPPAPILWGQGAQPVAAPGSASPSRCRATTSARRAGPTCRSPADRSAPAWRESTTWRATSTARPTKKPGACSSPRAMSARSGPGGRRELDRAPVAFKRERLAGFRARSQSCSRSGAGGTVRAWRIPIAKRGPFHPRIRPLGEKRDPARRCGRQRPQGRRGTPCGRRPWRRVPGAAISWKAPHSGRSLNLQVKL